MEQTARPNAIDPITLEVLRNALESIADEMGAVLKRTSFSPNIKERMDASCAIFDAEAQLVAQAEHVPVHLGSMLRAVRATVDAVGAIDEGDVVIVNDPFTGGSHLPDITIVAPVHFAEGQTTRHLGYVATRAHHADIGGMEPGSMPGKSREVYQEGIIIPAVKLYRRGELQDDIMRLILANVRTPAERRGDLNAQLAALRVGQQRVAELARRNGADLVTAGFAALLDYAERRMRRRLAEFPPGTYYAEDFLDDDGWSDEPVRVALAITVSPEKLVLDFAGSSPQRPGNINAVAPMTYSASFFAIKVLTDPEVPVNAGTFRSVELRLPEGSFLASRPPAAVCAGNTETTQRVADTVLKVCAQFAPDRVPAASQGTMNSVIIGGHDPRASGHARRTALQLLRDDRRRPGRAADGAGRRRHPVQHDEHDEHAGRGARNYLPAARRALRAARGFGGRGTASRRQRPDPRDPHSRPRGARVLAMRAPPLRALRAARRGRRQARPQRRAARRRQRRGAARQGQLDARRRRDRHRRNPGRRRLGQGIGIAAVRPILDWP